MADAEDLVQDVFLDCIQNKRLIEVKYPERYLLRAVKFSCYDYLKKRKISIPIDSTQNRIAESASPADENDLVYAYIIARLPEKTRQVFLLQRESGLSYRAIASKLHISIKTVESQMSRAIRICRQILKDLDFL